MADTGYRSIEVHVVNNTQANLVVQAASTSGGNSSWISEEQPKSGQTVAQYQDALWGVLTNDEDGSAMASVTLTGLGSSPVQIGFQNLWNGTSSVNVIPNDQIQGTVIQIQTGEINHTQYQVVLTPAPPAFPK